MSLREDDPINIANYDKLDRIGNGAFGQVYKIQCKNTKKIYAAKVANIELTSCSHQQLLSLAREVNILGRIAHAATVHFIGYYPEWYDGLKSPVIVTEYYKNGSLLNIIEFERRSNSHEAWNETKKLINIYGIASGMEYLHSNHIIHRDLKPANILMDDMLLPKIADFGLSKINQQTESMMSNSVSGIKGTPIYMAPEVFKFGRYSTAGDVYAFGFVVYEIITNQIPFNGLSTYEVMSKVSDGERPEFKVPIPNSYKNLIERCWAQNPEDRPTFSEIVELLKGDDFLTDDLDVNEFDSYLSYIDEFHAEYNSTRKIIDIKAFLTSQSKPYRSITVTKDGITYDMTQSDVSSVVLENQKLREYLAVLTDKKVSFDDLLVSHDDYEEKELLEETSTSKITTVIRPTTYIKKELFHFDHTSLRQFLDAAEKMYELRHPCIVQMCGFNYGDVSHPPAAFLSYEPYSLELLLEKNELDNFEKIRIIVEIVMGMRFLHSRDIIHRNLKPSTILLTDKKHVRINTYTIDSFDLDIIMQSQENGSLRFLAPELHDDNSSSSTSRADVYSFGALLFYVITNPYLDTSLEQILSSGFSSFPSDIVDWLVELIKNCLSDDPDARPSFNDILTTLRSHDFDLFDIGKKLPSQQQKMKQLIERRILEIEAYEYVLRS